MAAALKRCCDKCPHFQKRIRVEERTTDLSEGVRLLIFFYEITESGAVTKGNGQNSYTERKTGERFQRKTIGSCSRRDTCSFLHKHATGHRETMRKEVGDARRSHLEHSILFSTESEGTDCREKLKQSKGQSCDQSLKHLVYGRQDEKDRRVIIGTMPCVNVTSLETDAFVAFVAYIDMLMVRSNLSARSRKEGTQGAVAFLRKRRVQGCVSPKLRSNEFYGTES